MCEKNSGYKTFAHIRVSLDPSLRGGFYFVYGMAPPPLDEASHDSNYILLIDQPKSSAAAKTPLFTRVGVERQRFWRNQIRPFRHHLIERCSAILREQGSNDSLIVRAVRRVQERMTANGH